MQIPQESFLMKGEITQKDIQEGKRGHTSKCALALAVKRMTDNNPLLPKKLIISVTDYNINIYHPNQKENTKHFQPYFLSIQITLTPLLSRWIRNFDKKEVVSPTSIKTKQEKSIGGTTLIYLYPGDN